MEITIVSVVLFVSPVLAVIAVAVNILTQNRMPKIALICTKNAGRSQLAEAYLRFKYGPNYFVASGGIDPAAIIHPNILEVLKEQGMAQFASKPKRITKAMLKNAIAVVECRDDDIDEFLASNNVYSHLEDWSNLEDPDGANIEDTRGIFEEVKSRIDNLLVPYAEQHRHTSGKNPLIKIT